MADSIERGVVARSRKLIGMAAKVARHEVVQQIGERVSRSADRFGADSIARRVEQARILADGLSQLRGAAMKAGQFLSLDASDLLPPEAVEVLSRLQDKGQALPFPEVDAMLLSELGEDRRQRLEGLDEAPAASASIGQVHRARVDGRKVAVKVQFPGVAESIPSDLAVLKKIAGGYLALARRKIVLDEVFEELQTILELEANYEHELRSLDRYRENLGEDPRFVVPASYPELSSRRVLTMGWLDGEPFGQWLLREQAHEARDGVAQALLDLYCREFFEWGFVQTDPNPGNFLIMPEDRIGILDFGATLEYDERFRSEYVSILRVMADGSEDDVIEAGIEFNVLDPREGAEARRAFALMMEMASRPFNPRLQPFLFRDPNYQKEAREVVYAFVQSLKFTAPPRRLLFLHRKLGGLFNILKRLDVRLDLTPYWARMVGDSAFRG